MNKEEKVSLLDFFPLNQTIKFVYTITERPLMIDFLHFNQLNHEKDIL